MAAEAWGAARSWFLINGSSQGNQAACLALAQRGERVVVQRNVHSSTVDGLILSGLHPSFVAPEIDPDLGIAHCLTPEALDAALAATPGRGGRVRGLADLLRRGRGRGGPGATSRTRTACRWSWTRHGARTSPSTRLPEHAIAAGADLVVSSTHKIVGSLTQSAMLHLGRDRRAGRSTGRRSRGDAGRVDEPQLAAAGIARRGAQLRRRAGRGAARRDDPALAQAREEIRAHARARRARRAAGRTAGRARHTTRCGWRSTCAGPARTGYRGGRLHAPTRRHHLELAAENVVVAVFGMGETAHENADRLVAALRARGRRAAAGRDGTRARLHAPAARWGPLEMTPREAFLGAQEAVPVEQAVGRIASESLAAYPPGIPNVLPGRADHAGDWEYVQAMIARAARCAARATARCARRAWPSRPDDATTEPRCSRQMLTSGAGASSGTRRPYADDVVFVVSGPDAAEYHGRERPRRRVARLPVGVGRLLHRDRSGWCRETGRYALLIKLKARGKGSGVETDAEVANVVHLRDGAGGAPGDVLGPR